jgi:hypothetical protein
MQDNLGKAKIGISVWRYSPSVVMLDCGKPRKILRAISVHPMVSKRVLRNCSYHSCVYKFIRFLQDVDVCFLKSIFYRGADKSLARPGRKQATVTEDFDVHIPYL